MSANSRLTVASHILTWMALVARESSDPVTSDRIAASVRTNPVVIRRTLGLLAKAGLVESYRGINAGWRLAKDPREISLLNVFDALEEGPQFALHATRPSQVCPVGRSIGGTLSSVYGSIQDGVRKTLAEKTIEKILAETLASERRKANLL
ncbi:Rrf2 family transcriptional regulator [Paraburkholderia sp. C35]|uniref:Rrf2 family transcriptional regulator n=1 Tax=Paraburkholderia sp. C35 TaxID=2126993 RepID=UPI000D68E137|nr:Rrf2 family transcriptional regulator [Paraburkholderia sp. C35]